MGIYLGMFVGPVAVRSSMQKMGDDDGATQQNALGAMLVIGWATQCMLVFMVKGHTKANLVVGVGVLVAALVAFGTLVKEVGGTGSDNIFSWHPVLMAAAFMALMTPGQLFYRDDMQFSGRSAISGPGAKPLRRRWHAGFMATGSAVALFGGYFTIWSAHSQNGESQLGIGQTPSRLIHVWMGYATLTWVAIQTVAGGLKARRLVAGGEDRKSIKWHGRSGVYLLLLAYLTSAVGFWLHMNFDHRGWGTPFKLVLTGLVAVLVGSLVLDHFVFAGPATRRGSPLRLIAEQHHDR